MKKPLKIFLWVLGVFAAHLVALVIARIAWWSNLPNFFDDGEDSISWASSLPEKATEIEEWSWSDGFLPDYTYFMRARVSESGFTEFITKLDLTLHTASRSYSQDVSMLSWHYSPEGNVAWWNPSESLQETYVSESSDTWTFAKYEGGFLYFHSFSY